MKRALCSLALFATLISASGASANPDIASEWLNVTTDVAIRGYTIESNGIVQYECHYCSTLAYLKSGKHQINDGAVGRTVASETFGGLGVVSYSKTIGGATAFEHCYQASLEAQSNWNASQGMYSNSLCAPGAPAPPSGPGGTPPPLDSCDHCQGGSIVYEPLILDLNGDGIWTTSSAADPVWFDMDADGRVDRTGWTSGDHEDGFLYADWNGDGEVNDGSELFGDATIMPSGAKANHGFEALGAYDQTVYGGNEDGVISPLDDVWPRLRLWVDRNHNGRLDREERHTLRAMGVDSINLSYRKLGRAEEFGKDAAGNYHTFQGTFSWRDRGTVRDGDLHEIYFPGTGR